MVVSGLSPYNRTPRIGLKEQFETRYRDIQSLAEDLKQVIAKVSIPILLHRYGGTPLCVTTKRLRVNVADGSFTSFPPSRPVRFAPRADILPKPAFTRTHTSARTARSEPFRFV